MGISVQKNVREIITNLHLLTEELDAWGHMRLRSDWKQLTETWKGTSSEQRLTQRRRKAPHLLVTLTSLLHVKGHTLTWNNRVTFWNSADGWLQHSPEEWIIKEEPSGSTTDSSTIWQKKIWVICLKTWDSNTRTDFFQVIYCDKIIK